MKKISKLLQKLLNIAKVDINRDAVVFRKKMRTKAVKRQEIRRRKESNKEKKKYISPKKKKEER